MACAGSPCETHWHDTNRYPVGARWQHDDHLNAPQGHYPAGARWHHDDHFNEPKKHWHDADHCLAGARWHHNADRYPIGARWYYNDHSNAPQGHYPVGARWHNDANLNEPHGHCHDAGCYTVGARWHHDADRYHVDARCHHNANLSVPQEHCYHRHDARLWDMLGAPAAPVPNAGEKVYHNAAEYPTATPHEYFPAGYSWSSTMRTSLPQYDATPGTNACDKPHAYGVAPAQTYFVPNQYTTTNLRRTPRNVEDFHMKNVNSGAPAPMPYHKAPRPAEAEYSRAGAHFPPHGLERRCVDAHKAPRPAEAVEHRRAPSLSRRDNNAINAPRPVEAEQINAPRPAEAEQINAPRPAEAEQSGVAVYFAPPGLPRRMCEAAEKERSLTKSLEQCRGLPVTEDAAAEEPLLADPWTDRIAQEVLRQLNEGQQENESESDYDADDERISVHCISSQEIVRDRDLATVKRLAKGGSGTVFHVRHKKTGANYALKEMDLECTRGRSRKVMEECSRVEEEASARVAGSPWVVNVHQVSREDEFVAILMELCPRGDFRKFLNKYRRQLYREDKRQLVGEIVLALEHIHSRGVVHRDLKPENVLMDATGHLKLTDFDLAHTDMRTTPKDKGFCSGTLLYMSPEVVRGRAHNSCVDWWALGCILYEIFAGKTPFDVRGDTDEELFDRVKHERVGDFGGHFKRDPEAFDLVLCLLDKDPAYRLGARGAAEVKAHPWFDGFDWDALANHTMLGMAAYFP